MKTLVYSTVLAISIMLSSCYLGNGQLGIRGEGPVVERKIELKTIEGISLSGSAKVFLTQGKTQEVKIEGQENIIDNLNREVSGEVWDIGNKRSVWQSEELKIYITLETLRLIKVSGSGDIEFVNHFEGDKDLEIRISGAGKINLDMDADDISGNISGSGDLYMKGKANSLDFSITGSGNIAGYELITKKADVRISGSGGMDITVEDHLDAHITGSGSIHYKGDPKVNSSVTGSGSVRSR